MKKVEQEEYTYLAIMGLDRVKESQMKGKVMQE